MIQLWAAKHVIHVHLDILKGKASVIPIVGMILRLRKWNKEVAYATSEKEIGALSGKIKKLQRRLDEYAHV